jgi:hypothetical protein
MTNEMMSLRTLLEESSDAELLCEMVGFAAQRAGGECPIIGVRRAVHHRFEPSAR